MKRKFIIKLIFIVIVILIITMILFTRNNVITNNKDDIISKGNRMFGDDYCPKDNNDYLYEDYEHQRVAGEAITPYKCKICNKNYDYPNTNIPKICSSCANITGRCMQCGKLKKVSK